MNNKYTGSMDRSNF